MSKITRHQVFGKANAPTIYYLTAYGSSIRQIRLHIRLLARAGFRIVAFEYDKDILNAGDPSLLPEAIEAITVQIEQDRRKHIVAGVFGMSLGGYIGFNVMKQTGIRHGFFCTGGVRASDTIWTRPGMKREKLAFENAGHTRESLEKTWQDIDKAHEFKDKTIFVICSVDDELLLHSEASKNFAEWQKQGTTMELIELKHSKHIHTVIRSLFRFKMLVGFFRQATQD